MDFNEFYKKYDFSDNLFHRIAGISGECVKAMREGKNVRPKTRKRIEAVMQCVIDNDLHFPRVIPGREIGWMCGDDRIGIEKKKEQERITNLVRDYLSEQGL